MTKTTRARYTLEFKPGGNYALFLNLDSPLTSELTNLREMHSYYGPSTNVVKLRDGRWLAGLNVRARCGV